ncbi:MAG: hypothetical protein IAE91_07750 [Ignavibacteriaceae bacterium]|nr:hypothetical protein [Ignavibacteriaceae bacterium]
MNHRIILIILSVLISAAIWVAVTLSSDFTHDITVETKLVLLDSGQTAGSRFPPTITIKLRGNGWKFAALMLGELGKFNIDASKPDNNGFINLRGQLSINEWLSSDLTVVEIIPSEVRLQTEKLQFKTVPVIPNYDPVFVEGFGLASEINVFPSEILISGSESIISKINSVATEFRTINGLKEKTSVNLRLQLIRGVTFNTGLVRIDFDVQKISDKEFANLPIEMLNVPNDRAISLIPDEITLALRGGIEKLAALNPSEIKIFLKYEDIATDTTGSLQPQIEVPANIEILQVKPNRIRYIIKKY